MRLGALTNTDSITLPVWPPLLATRGAGAASSLHAHHAMHVVLAAKGELTIRVGDSAPIAAPGVVSAPDVPHAHDATGKEVLLVFLEPESDAGSSD